MTGHRNLAQLKVYIEKVDQNRLADAAMARLTANKGENKSSNRARKIF